MSAASIQFYFRFRVKNNPIKPLGLNHLSGENQNPPRDHLSCRSTRVLSASEYPSMFIREYSLNDRMRVKQGLRWSQYEFWIFSISDYEELKPEYCIFLKNYCLWYSVASLSNITHVTGFVSVLVLPPPFKYWMYFILIITSLLLVSFLVILFQLRSLTCLKFQSFWRISLKCVCLSIFLSFPETLASFLWNYLYYFLLHLQSISGNFLSQPFSHGQRDVCHGQAPRQNFSSYSMGSMRWNKVRVDGGGWFPKQGLKINWI